MRETTTIRMKVDTVNCFNNTIDYINTLVSALEREAPDYDPPFCASDIGFKIILGYIEDIAHRAEELQDEKLIKALEGLGIKEPTNDKTI